MTRIAIVGCGNMGEAIAAGLLASGHPREDLVASHPRADRRKDLEKRLGLRAVASNADAAREADVVLLAVKPQILPSVLPDLAEATRGKLVVSVAAGTPASAITAALPEIRLVRAMPNQPAAVRAGLTGLWAAPSVGEADRALVTKIFESVGGVEWVAREELFHAVTALSACGPGFLYAIADALADGGVAAGLPRATALRLAGWTMAGAGRTLVETGEHPAALKDKVASPGGTTIHGLAAMEKAGVRGALIAAVRAAADRSREMGGEPGRATSAPKAPKRTKKRKAPRK